jgi:hypothetical protein
VNRAALCERLLSKIVMPGPATPCATWIGAYNQSRGFKKGHQGRYRETRRPVVRERPHQVGGVMIYVAPTMLRLAEIEPERAEQRQACHRGCPTGPAWQGVYSCVDLDHLRWGTQVENEADKYGT